MIEEWDPNPDLGTETLIHSVIASPAKGGIRCAAISLKKARLLRFPRNDNF